MVDLNRQSLDRVVPDIAAGPARGDVRGGRLARRDGQVRAAAADASPALRARIDAMPNEEYQRLLRADARRAARAARGRRAAGRRRRAARRVPRPRRPRPGRADRGLPRRRRRARPPERRLRVHDQGLAAAHRGPPREPLRAARAPSSSPSWRRRSAPIPTTRGRASTSGTPEAELCAAAASARLRREPPALASPPPVPETLGREHRGQRVHPAGVRALLGRPRARGARRSRSASSPCRPTSAPRPTSAAGSTRPGIWSIGDRIDWFADDTDTLVRWRESDHGQHIELGIAEVNLVGAARRAGRDVVARRPAAAAGRHDLRPVRRARARAVVVRHLRGRAVDPRRHAERRHARPRGRRAPVGDHAVDRDRAAGLRRLGARVRARLRVDVPARAVAARAPGRRLGVLPPLARGRSTRRWPATADARRTCSRAATGCARARGVVIAVMGALVPEAMEAAEELGARRSSASRAPTCCSAPSRPAPASPTATRGSSTSCSRRAAADRLAARRPPAHAQLPRRRSTASGSTCLGVQRFGQSGDIVELYEHHQIDAESVVGAALDLLD